MMECHQRPIHGAAGGSLAGTFCTLELGNLCPRGLYEFLKILSDEPKCQAPRLLALPPDQAKEP